MNCGNKGEYVGGGGGGGKGGGGIEEIARKKTAERRIYMDEEKLKEKEYDRAQAMIMEKNERVWQLFGFFITINLAYLGAIFYAIINHLNCFMFNGILG